MTPLNLYVFAVDNTKSGKQPFRRSSRRDEVPYLPGEAPFVWE